jgi:phage terminase large subunit-like protein
VPKRPKQLVYTLEQAKEIKLNSYLKKMDPETKSYVLKLLKEREARKIQNRIQFYEPYEYQKKFHTAGFDCPQRILMAANRVGKTFCGAAETAYHLTGEYPDWWKGRRFTLPVRVWVAGESNDTTRDIIQKELFGSPQDPSQKGTGAIPLDRIVDTVRKPGVPNAFSSAIVKHISGGNSTVNFKAYEQGFEKFMGESVDVVWLDEEPPANIFSQCITRTADTSGLVYMTFTPEKGMTSVVSGFLNELKPGQALITATWDDVEHLDPKTKEQLLAVYTPSEREMRSKGIPVFGSGLVFPISEEKIVCDDFEFPDHFRRIAGLDFGYDHPTAVSWAAFDPDNDIIYIYDEYRRTKETPLTHSAVINSRSPGIPVAFPHDGLQHDKGSGIQLAQQYRDLGVYMLTEHFSNPPANGETRGNNSVEAGISLLLQRFETGRLFIFKSCVETLEEIRLYHRKDGKIVTIKDDLVSAMRYAALSVDRFGDRAVHQKTSFKRYGFDNQIQYNSKGIV